MCPTPEWGGGEGEAGTAGSRERPLAPPDVLKINAYISTHGTSFPNADPGTPQDSPFVSVRSE